MNHSNLDHLLIDYILTLLNVSQMNHIAIDQLMTKSKQEAFSLLPNSQEILTAYELITFMDEMPGGFFIYQADDAEQLIYANKAMLRIFQCDTLEDFRELTGNSFKGIVHPDDLEAVEQSISEQISRNQYNLDYVEYRIIRKDGEIRWIEDYGHFVHSESTGDFFYVFIGDATEKKNRQQLEKAFLINEKDRKLQILIEEYDRERSLINQEYLRRLRVIEGLSINYESILYVDLDTNKILPYRLSNRTQKQFKQEFQISDFLWFNSDYINTWVHPEDRELVAKITSPKYIREKLSNRKTFYINYRVINNEKVQYLQLRIVDVSTENQVSQIVMGYRRVDKEIQHEMEQKQILENALNNVNLAMAAKNTFLSNMSHDMRTPLNAIFGYTTLAKKNINDSRLALDYLDKIAASSGQLLDLIDKVLEISWLESHNIDIIEVNCNINNIMQELYTFLLPQALEKNIILSLNTDKLEHPDICGDRDKIKQLLLYIANNAVAYTEAGGKVSLSVKELESLQDNFAVYQFEVKDTGIGISENFLTHIYEPFEREKNTTFSGIHGTGLGLTITKNIVDMMGGSIDINSVLHEGSTFTVTLSLRIQDSPLSVLSASKDIDSPPPNPSILLVEDNEINQEIETEILREQGFIIDTAANGSIAVEKVAHSQPGDYDLILMDIQMPVMDGLQAARAIRELENPRLANIPIIALSANAFESDRHASMESGMNAHLTKPIDVPQLLDAISNLIQTHTS